jgi:mono/diheme cytochrome c family protein
MKPLAAALVLGLAAAGCIDGEWTDPMDAHQPRYRRYGPSEFFADGRAMRPPIEGTVPRERRLGAPELIEGRTAAGQLVATVPVPVTRELLTRGRRQFDIYCALCHGFAGDGASIVAGNMSLRRPPSLHEARLRNQPAGHFYNVIKHGYGLMAPYANELSIDDRWAVVAYVRALQLSQDAQLDDAPPEARAQLAKQETR